jgi:hypothetical protein
MTLELDHIAVACRDLQDGQTYVEQALGVELQPGGRHAHYGTHNMLLGLEDGLYLEVIAIDRQAPEPDYPRWFDLDRFTGAPRITNWICRTDDLSGFVASHPQAGEPVPLARGDLRWQMSVPPSGILPYDNAFPAVIEWESRPHPATRLTASGCRLRQLIVSHPAASELGMMMQALLADERVQYEAGSAGYQAIFDTPNGTRVMV